MLNEEFKLNPRIKRMFVVCWWGTENQLNEILNFLDGESASITFVKRANSDEYVDCKIVPKSEVRDGSSQKS